MLAGSVLCNKGELDIYGVPPTLTTMDRAHINEHQPLVSPAGNIAPIEFIIPRQMEKWTDLMETELNLSVKMIKTENGENFADDSNVSVIGNLLHSLFSHIDVFINGKLMSGNDKYPYRAFIETMCGSSESDQDMLEDTQMWGKPRPGEIREFTTFGAANNTNGAKVRNIKLTEGKIVELQGKIHRDLTRQSKMLPNMCELKFRFVRSPKEFYMIGNDSAGGKIEILKAIIKVRTVSLDPNILLSLNNALRSSPMKMPIKNIDINVFTVMDGLRSKIESNLIHGQIPKRIIIGQVLYSVMNGDITHSPFAFNHFNISKLKVSVDGSSIKTNPLRMDFTTAGHNIICQSYRSFWKGLGIEHGKNHVFPISVYNKQHTLWTFDLTPDLGCEEGHLHPIRNGNVEFDMEWSTAIEHPINVIVYVEYDDMLMIDGLRNMITS